jgi:AraC-like DNA-binding protein
VKDELRNLGIPYLKIESGLLMLQNGLSNHQEAELRKRLSRFGLELLSREDSEAIKEIIRAVEEMPDDLNLHATDFGLEYFSKRTRSDWDTYAELFAEVKGISVRQYLLSQKLERVKVALIYTDVLIRDLADRFSFTNLSALRNEFKKYTGITPQFYRSLKTRRARLITAPVASDAKALNQSKG